MWEQFGRTELMWGQPPSAVRPAKPGAFAVARVERALLPAAFDLALDFTFDSEPKGPPPAASATVKERRLSAAQSVKGGATPQRREQPTNPNLLEHPLEPRIVPASVHPHSNFLARQPPIKLLRLAAVLQRLSCISPLKLSKIATC
jgi:hypothetical protein